MGLCHIEKYHTYTLQEFKVAQAVWLEEVRNFVYKFQEFFFPYYWYFGTTNDTYLSMSRWQGA